MDKLFPAQISDRSVESLLSGSNSTGRYIYMVTVIALALAITSLFFIRVDVVRSARGIIRSPGVNLELKSTGNGNIKMIGLAENLPVTNGDTLLILETPVVDQKIIYLNKQIREITGYISDLDRMCRGLPPGNTDKYQQEWFTFCSGKSQAEGKTAYSEKELRIAEGLSATGAIPVSELDEIRFRYTQAVMTENEVKGQYFQRWQQEKSDYTNTLRQLRHELDELNLEKSVSVLTAPSSGVLMNCTGLNEGSYCFAGQYLAELSSGTDLLAECYLSPAEIACLETGMPVSLRIDAYDHREWGVLEGRVTSIAEDILISEGQPVYRVRIQPESCVLFLRDGTPGKLKKGMTLTAGFILNRRTLIQLIFDRAETYFDPLYRKSSSDNEKEKVQNQAT